MTNRLRELCIVLVVAVAVGGCGAARAFRQGDDAMRRGDLDQAVASYRRAAQADPDNARYKISLERAMQAASRFHLDRAREFEQQELLEAALSEYKLASEYDPSNRGIGGKVASIEKTLRDRIELARPKPAGQRLREQARAASAQPILNPAIDRINLTFNNVGFREILNAIGAAAGINVTYDREVVDRPTTLQLNDLSVDQALNQVMQMNQLSYKILSERSIFVFPDTVAKHTQYDEQAIRTFFLQSADPTEVIQTLSSIIRIPNIAIQPIISPNKASNSITIRASTSIMSILERMIEQLDKPRAEIVFDIEILEVDRERTKSYGLNLTDYALGTIFSPEVSPSSTTTTTPATGTGTGTTGTTTTTTATGRSTKPGDVVSPPAFNLNTISRGVTTADFYLAVPAAIVSFLETDSRTRLLAKPQLRGAEGAKLTVNLGSEVPIVTTSYTPIATGGAGVNPLNSFQLKSVGINFDLTPRVTLDGDILLDLNIESSAPGPNKSVAGTDYPSFTTRKVTTKLRLRDGESNLLAGLLREDDTNGVQGVPGAVRVPFLKQVFSGNKMSKSSIDLIMLLTPHIIRTSEIGEADLRPIYIGSQQTGFNLGGPPPLIAPQPEPEPAVPAPAPPAPAQPGRPAGFTPGAPSGTTPGAPASPPLTPPGTVLVPPPGSTPIPGVVVQPAPPSAAPAPAAPAPTPGQPPPQAPPPQAAAPEVPPPVTPPPPQAASPVGVAQIIVSPPGTTFRVGQGPYTVPLSIVGAARLSTITLTLTFDPMVLRVRSITEGSFMRSGGATTTFAQQSGAGRVDFTITRGADATGASGTGLLAAVVFDAIAPGSITLTPSGAGTGPGGTAMGLQFRPVAVTVNR